MDWQKLKSFYTIVKLGNVTRAAEALFRTQSALSQQIAKLEQDLHCSLFHRIGKNALTLTPAGEEVFAFAEKIFLQERTLVTKLQSLSGKYEGDIYIAAPYAAHKYILSDILPRFQKQYPKLFMHILDYTPQRCIESVQQGKVDFCFVHKSTAPSSLHTVPWKRGQYMVIVPKGHALTTLPRIELKDLVQYPLNLPRQHVKAPARDKLDKACDAAGLTYQAMVESPNAAVNITYAAQGIGVGFLLCYANTVQHFADQAVFLPLSHIFPDEFLVVCTRKDIEQTECKRAFTQFILHEADAQNA